MKLLTRLIGLCALIALVMSPALLLAQETPVTVVGSGVTAPLFEALVSGSGVSIGATPTVSGTRAGLEQLCQGLADIALANRGLNDAEDSACAGAGIEYVEVLLGDFAVAAIIHPADTFATCLSAANLTALLAPNAEGVVTNWRALFPEGQDIALNVIVPPNTTPAYALIDGLVDGDGLRADATIEADQQAIVTAVSTTPGTLGIVRYTIARQHVDTVSTLALSPVDGGCAVPTATTIASGQYPAAQRLYAYINRAALDKPGVADLFNYIVSGDTAATYDVQGFLAPSADENARNVSILTDRVTGRQFSAPSFEFLIPPGLVGTLNVGGDSAGTNFFEDLTTTFQSTYPGVTSNVRLEGRVASARRLCNGELDLIAATGPLTDEQAGNCAANNIVPVTFNLGTEAVVVIANAGSSYLQCLTLDQIATIWRENPAAPVTTWSQVDAEFPATPMTLIAPNDGSAATDLLLTRAAGVSAGSRTDAVTDPDALYRAASVAVVDGALTYMTWRDYQRVLDGEQANIQPVSIDAGSGCVAPTEAAIADGSYGLSRPLSMIVSQTALRRPEVQSLLWYTFSDENHGRFGQLGLLGVDFAELPALRSSLQDAFDAAGAAAAAEATAEPTAEATPGGDSQAQPASGPTPTSAG